ncbi:MAG TPA: histidine phosphatase family protein, partial [Kiloniellaceae bacterium]
MSRLLAIRHGATAWNAAGRIQGRSDQPLSPAGRAAVAAWQLPPQAAGARW